MVDSIRNPKQQRAIEKKERIIKEGFELICKYGYYNINTAQIAKEANVSTGIVYQYFKDKYDILIEGLEKYGDNIFFPILKNDNIKIDKTKFEIFINEIIKQYINNHKISNIAHEEIMSMVHSDKQIAQYYYRRELEMTNYLKKIFIKNGFDEENLFEKVHITLGLIDNLCHEIIYHKHNNMNYEIMTNIIIDNIKYLFKNDLI